MGKVYLMGAGPGAADLLTVRAARVLAIADIVFYDALVYPETLALAPRAKLVPVGKRCGAYSTAQQFINRRLIDAARRYPVVVRLKGGDPMLFGRAQEEIDALRVAGILVEVVPGVTAAFAASAELGVSLTRRALSRSVVFATPRIGESAKPSEWIQSVVAADTAVLYMAYGELAAIAGLLLAAGKPQGLPVAIVEGASLDGPAARFYTLAELTGFDSPPSEARLPVVICIGEVYRESLAASRAMTVAHTEAGGRGGSESLGRCRPQAR